jgi:hypothetical protein
MKKYSLKEFYKEAAQLKKDSGKEYKWAFRGVG